LNKDRILGMAQIEYGPHFRIYFFRFLMAVYVFAVCVLIVVFMRTLRARGSCMLGDDLGGPCVII